LYGCTALLLALVAMAYLAGFRLNVTPSLPKGLYRLTTAPIRIGTPVFFCLESPDFIRLAAERGYAGSGACPGALRPLGKEVYGLPGDRIDFNQGQIKVNGRILVGSAAKSEDRQGRTMPASRLQPGLIPAGYALVLSLHHSGSFDSRYFGLVSLAALRPVKPVSTY
jgi:conjugative transfer signal peptidase TraF